MRVIKTTVSRVCAICERTLLQGEHALRYSPDGSRFVDVCPLCSDIALDHGWVREGVAVSPALQQVPRRRRQKSLWQALLGAREEVADPVVSEPILRRLSDDEIALVEAAELFNATQFRRTIAGVGRALGEAKASIIPLSGVNAEMVLTFGWDLSWYQYRVSPGIGTARAHRRAWTGPGRARPGLPGVECDRYRGRSHRSQHRAALITSRRHVRRGDLHLGSSIAAA